MEFVLVELDNSKAGCAVGGENVRREILDKALEGYMYVSYIPYQIGPSGKILSYDLMFAKGDVKDVKFENIKAQNVKTGIATFSGYEQIINSYLAKDYFICGAIPTLMGPSGKVLEMDLIFAK